MATIPANTAARRFGVAEFWICMVALAVILTVSLPVPSVRTAGSPSAATAR